MPITLKCPCGKKFRVKDELAGSRGRCPECGTIIDIPKANEDVPTLTPVREDRPAYTPEDLYQRVIDSVVGIVEDGVLVGSGFFIDPAGLFTTNRHVVGIKTRVTARLTSGIDYEVRVIRSFRSLDLAFAYAEVEKIGFATLAGKGELKVGQTVFAIGHPMRLQNTLTQGIVSAVGRLIGRDRYIQTSAPINPGNSGGPLFNEFGDVVGMNTMVLTQSQGIGLAIPSEIIAEKYRDIRDDLADLLRNSYCGICGSSSPDHTYCVLCGASLEEKPADTGPSEEKAAAATQPTSCPSCKVAVTPNDRYCPRCGTRL
ncbi:MAG: trypsin-like peptidase domain-containing protein [Thermodesulfobacteriota bacterium]